MFHMYIICFLITRLNTLEVNLISIGEFQVMGISYVNIFVILLNFSSYVWNS